MLLVDTEKKLFIRDEDLKRNLAQLRPCAEWLQVFRPSTVFSFLFVVVVVVFYISAAEILFKN